MDSILIEEDLNGFFEEENYIYEINDNVGTFIQLVCYYIICASHLYAIWYCISRDYLIGDDYDFRRVLYMFEDNDPFLLGLSLILVENL